MRRGEADDPVAGIVRFTASGDRSVNVLLGHGERGLQRPPPLAGHRLEPEALARLERARDP